MLGGLRQTQFLCSTMQFLLQGITTVVTIYLFAICQLSGATDVREGALNTLEMHLGTL